MKVFHGSYTVISEIDLTKGRNNLDFGKWKNHIICQIMFRVIITTNNSADSRCRTTNKKYDCQKINTVI
jgi:hypothetical protein